MHKFSQRGPKSTLENKIKPQYLQVLENGFQENNNPLPKTP